MSPDKSEIRQVVFGVHFGALAKPIAQQLREQGFKVPASARKAIKHLQLDADALVRLTVRGYINDSLKRALHNRLIRAISAAFSSDSDLNRK